MRKWEDSLRERLAASEDYAVEYLNAVLEEDDPQAFLLALRHVAEARGGMDKMAVEAELSRDSLYRSLQDALGMRLTVARKQAA